ncbi:Integrase, catalytic region [Geotalea uraniireducens Rf4]|uniref:Integrase, catalytic region n=1 Tax=Geotalea uraniireducens (strain Rf4) TaxID=351605 RepID=A5G853_GEOUR|nr:Integrase, catalytic region [Geotalea uraniireducens Rf4]ABQ27971.1 Integrase, catalytic region [Geotalea uraniireducens Rf4]
MQRWHLPDEIPSDGRKAASRDRAPANKLSETERVTILATANQEKFASLPPSQIVPKLADDGIFLASESTFYRTLRAEKQLAHRGRTKAARHKRPDAVLATEPNQLWSWDITYLSTTVKGLYFYLYLIMDVFSRKIVGWEVYAEESADHAAITLRKAYLREGVAGRTLILHSDNGSPMKGATMLGTMQKLGVMPSFSRPSVSNDNPYSESLFKTLKYHPGLPEKPFDTLDEARHWVAGFQHWYNEEHQHSAIKFVTPGQRHRGDDKEILNKRALLYAMARAAMPERWSGACRNWTRPAEVSLNPQKSAQNGTPSQARAA